MNNGGDSSAAGPQGRRIVSTRGSSAAGCATALGVVVVALVVLAATSSNTTFVTFALAFALLSAIAIGFAIRELRRWEELEFVLPEWPLSLGSNAVAHLHKRAKSSIPDRELPVTGMLFCQEKVTYQVGTDTRTDKRNVYELPFSVPGHVRNNLFEAQVPIAIPLGRGGPTIDFDHNEITWRVEFELSELSKLSAKQSFELLVAPVLDGRAGVIQDASSPPS